VPPTDKAHIGTIQPTSGTTSAADRTAGVRGPAAGTYASATSVLPSTHSAQQRLAPAAAPAQAPAEAPQPPSLPFTGSTAAASAFSSATLFAILVALSALALSQFGRLRLTPARWRCAAFIALLERPG
jgi:hypothetical protein